MKTYFPFVLAAATLIQSAVAQPVTSAVAANGRTATGVSVDGAGRVHIDLAPAQTGVSYNGFSQFDVGKPGLSFENQSANARTIVAEVFSASPSRLAGDLEVNGPRANLILANQNGISVNGAGFVNFGSVALTTGAITLRDERQSSGLMQRYVDATTRQGSIDIGEQGLAGNLIRLELIAKDIAINGPVTNTYTSATAQVGLAAGQSRASFDTVASPVDNLTPWVYYEADEASEADPSGRGDFAITIGAGSKISSGRIDILVTDKGAGVKNEGELAASAGDFTLSASGELRQVGGQVRALGSINIQTANVVQQTSGGQISLLSAGQQVNVQASGTIQNLGGEITGGQRASDASPYAVLLKADGNIENSTPIGASQTAVIFGQGDAVRLESGADIISSNARVMSNAQLQMQAQGRVINESVHIPGESEVWRTPTLLRLMLLRDTGYKVDLGHLADPSNLGYWVAQGDVSVNGAQVFNKGGFIYANEGGISVQATSTFTNEAHSVGRYDYSKHCVLFLCKATAHSTEALVGGQIMAAGNVKIDAGQTVLNDGGTLYAGQGMQITAPNIIARAKPVHTVILRDEGLKALFGDTWAQIYATDQGGGFTAQQGRLILQGLAQQDGGTFTASEGVEGEIQVIRAPYRNPVRIQDHLGVLWW